MSSQKIPLDDRPLRGFKVKHPQNKLEYNVCSIMERMIICGRLNWTKCDTGYLDSDVYKEMLPVLKTLEYEYELVPEKHIDLTRLVVHLDKPKKPEK